MTARFTDVRPVLDTLLIVALLTLTWLVSSNTQLIENNIRLIENNVRLIKNNVDLIEKLVDYNLLQLDLKGGS